MYAVIESGGKQYRVAEGDVIQVEKLPLEQGKKVKIDRVLMVAVAGDVKVGRRSLFINIGKTITKSRGTDRTSRACKSIKSL
jgi:large subunit ribosomal protein L21